MEVGMEARPSWPGLTASGGTQEEWAFDQSWLLTESELMIMGWNQGLPTATQTQDGCTGTYASQHVCSHSWKLGWQWPFGNWGYVKPAVSIWGVLNAKAVEDMPGQIKMHGIPDKT